MTPTRGGPAGTRGISSLTIAALGAGLARDGTRGAIGRTLQLKKG